MSRSIWKGPFFHPNLLKKTQSKESYQKLKVWSRASTILHEFIGHSFEIHNGKNFLPFGCKVMEIKTALFQKNIYIYL